MPVSPYFRLLSAIHSGADCPLKEGLDGSCLPLGQPQVAFTWLAQLADPYLAEPLLVGPGPIYEAPWDVCGDLAEHVTQTLADSSSIYQ